MNKIKKCAKKGKENRKDKEKSFLVRWEEARTVTVTAQIFATTPEKAIEIAISDEGFCEIVEDDRDCMMFCGPDDPSSVECIGEIIGGKDVYYKEGTYIGPKKSDNSIRW